MLVDVPGFSQAENGPAIATFMPFLTTALATRGICDILQGNEFDPGIPWIAKQMFVQNIWLELVLELQSFLPSLENDTYQPAVL